MDGDEHLAYTDFLTESFSLTHVNRKPLDLNRIPDHLCVKIASQQSLQSSLNLMAANSRYCNLVEAAFLQNPYVQFLRKMFREHKKTDLFGPCGFSSPSKFLVETEALKNLHLNFWITHILRHLRRSCYLWRKGWALLEEMTELEVSLEFMHHRHVSVLWNKEQALGPRRICLRSISDEIWIKIFPKVPAVAATRLARTRSNAAAALEEYIQNTMPVRVMVQAERSVINPVINPVANHYNDWLYEQNRCYYQKLTLYENAIHLFYNSRHMVTHQNRVAICRILNRRRTSSARNDEWNKIRNQLGYGHGLYDVYYVDRRPPRPALQDIYAETFLKLYGEALQ